MTTHIKDLEKKSIKLVKQLEKGKEIPIDLADTIKNSITQIDNILKEVDWELLKPKNARELSQLLNAKSNLTKALASTKEESRGLILIDLIEKKIGITE